LLLAHDYLTQRPASVVDNSKPCFSIVFSRVDIKLFQYNIQDPLLKSNILSIIPPCRSPSHLSFNSFDLVLNKLEFVGFMSTQTSKIRMERKWQLRATAHKKELMAMIVVKGVDVNNGRVLVVMPTTITLLLSPTQLA
jgi:hypothetical protein